MPEAAVQKRAAMLAAGVSSFLTPYLASCINVALPSIARTFRLDAVTMTWVGTAYALAAAACVLPFGRIADLRGRKRIFVAGLIIDGISSLLCSMAPNSHVLIAVRVMQGVGGAMIFGTGVAILTSVFPPGERGRALGANVACVYSGLATGPFIGGILTTHFGWRSIFLVAVGLAMIAAWVAATRLQGEWSGDREERFDTTGALLYGPSLAALMYGVTGLSQAPERSAILITAGVVGLVAFVLWELRAPAPLLDVSLLRRNRPFALSNLAAFINYSATAASGYLLSLYLQYPKHHSPEDAGIVLLVQPVMMTIFSPLAGRLSDRIEPRVVASVGMGLTAAGLAVLNLLKVNTPIEMVVLCLVLLGIGFGLFSSPNTNAVMSSVDRTAQGTASGILGTMRLTGQMLSMGIVMFMLATYLGRAAIGPNNYDAFLACARACYTMFTVLCALGILASLARGRIR